MQRQPGTSIACIPDLPRTVGREDLKERIADRLLTSHPLDKSRPAYTERRRAYREHRRKEQYLEERTDVPPVSADLDPMLLVWDDINAAVERGRITTEQWVLIKCYWRGYTQAQIAEATGYSQQSISNHLREAVLAVRVALLNHPYAGLAEVLAEVFHMRVEVIKAILDSDW